MGIKPAQSGQRFFLLAAILPTELSMLTTNSFQNHTWFLNMPPKCFDFNVYKQTKCKHGHNIVAALSCIAQKVESLAAEHTLFSIMRRCESHQCFHFFFFIFIVSYFHMYPLSIIGKQFYYLYKVSIKWDIIKHENAFARCH